MTTRTHPPTLTPGRIAALAAIAVVAILLAAIWAGRGRDAVRVPDGARAGQLSLERCTYATEAGDLPADCGTLVVPENRDDPRSRLIALPVTRIHARSGRSAEPIFRLEGGPGKTNLAFPQASRYVDRHDLVLVGYRGVDGSSRLDCPEVDDARRRSGDLVAERSLRASAGAFGRCARRLQAGGTDLGGYSLSERVDDLEAARTALRYGRVHLLSESAGTRTAMIYAWRHPRSIRRSVMVGVNPPGGFLYRQRSTVDQLRRFDALCAQDAGCAQRPDGIAASMRRTLDDLPRRWGLLPIRRGNLQLASFFGLMESSGAGGPIAAPLTLDAWRAASRGDASGLWFQSLAAGTLFPRAQVWGDSASVARADGAVAARHFAAAPRGASPLGDAANRFLWGAGGMLRAWPANHDDDLYARVRTSRVPTLLVSGRLDGATPVAAATRDLLRHLPNGRQVVLEDMGHTGDFWSRQPAAGTRLVTAFLDAGKVDRSQYVPQPLDVTPGLRQTALAKGVVGAMLLLGLGTVASLARMAGRARTGRRSGVKARAFHRSVHASLLGLGGWLLAALGAMVVLPDVPVDATLLVVGSIGVPVGLAVHWTSVDPASPRAAALRAGLAALAGALVGAWLGWQAPGSALGLLTAIPGAVAGANLAVLGRVLARGLRERRTPVVPAEERVRVVA